MLVAGHLCLSPTSVSKEPFPPQPGEGGLTLVVVSKIISLCSNSATIFTCPSLEARCKAFNPFWKEESLHESRAGSELARSPLALPCNQFRFSQGRGSVVQPRVLGRGATVPHAPHASSRGALQVSCNISGVCDLFIIFLPHAYIIES